MNDQSWVNQIQKTQEHASVAVYDVQQLERETYLKGLDKIFKVKQDPEKGLQLFINNAGDLTLVNDAPLRNAIITLQDMLHTNLPAVFSVEMTKQLEELSNALWALYAKDRRHNIQNAASRFDALLMRNHADIAIEVAKQVNGKDVKPVRQIYSPLTVPGTSDAMQQIAADTLKTLRELIAFPNQYHINYAIDVPMKKGASLPARISPYGIHMLRNALEDVAHNKRILSPAGTSYFDRVARDIEAAGDQPALYVENYYKGQKVAAASAEIKAHLKATAEAVMELKSRCLEATRMMGSRSQAQ